MRHRLVTGVSAARRPLWPPQLTTAPPPACLLLLREMADTGGTRRQQSTPAEEAPTEPFYDWSMGSHFYFSEAEEKRLFPHSELPSVLPENRNPEYTISVPRSSAPAPCGTDESGAPGSASTLVKLQGVTRTAYIDVSIPPIRREEAERWKFEYNYFVRGLAISHEAKNKQRKINMLLPVTAPVTYLGEDVRKIDQALRQKGHFTISEVAEVFIPLVPTFPVESRHVMAQVPPDIIARIQSIMGMSGTFAQAFFSRYPVLFHHLPSRFRRSLVHLNPTFWFVRQHPGFGKADRKLQRFKSHVFDDMNAMDHGDGPAPMYAAAVGDALRNTRRSTSAEMLDVLIRNLPRVPTPPEPAAVGAQPDNAPPSRTLVVERYRPMQLLKWISSFPPADLAFMNTVQEQYAVHLITQYVNVFQLMAMQKGDHNLFVEASVLLAGTEGSAWRVDEVRSATATSAGEGEPGEEDEEGTSWWTADGNGAERRPSAPETAAEVGPSSSGGTAASLDRERAFRQAIADELIGMDSLVDGDDGDATGRDADGDGDGDGDSDGSRHNLVDGRGEYGDEAEVSGDVTEEDGTRSASPLSSHNARVSREFQSDTGGSEMSAVGLPLEEIYVRRLPPHVAPRSLSDLDEITSPDRGLLVIAARLLAPPPTAAKGAASGDSFFHTCRPTLRKSDSTLAKVWRWVAVERLYEAFSVPQRRILRERYKGLVGFLRYHGKLFEVSSDFMFVIAHDPNGTLAPIPPFQRRFGFANRAVLPADFDDNPDRSASIIGDAERRQFVRSLGEGMVPTTRRHLLLMDPNNPLLDHDVLYDEIANLAPEYPINAQALLAGLPPVMRAALPFSTTFRSCPRLEVFNDGSKLRVKRKTERSASANAAAAKVVAPSMSIDEAVAELLQLPLNEEVSLQVLPSLGLSRAVKDKLSDHFGSLRRAFLMLPQYFETRHAGVGRKRIMMVRLRQ
ncbi:hypothetical protein NESM_000134800 [Novymonas esmeraldas]|uniref:Uncharacterized protein n=1 Tax=Novymonas esmeraldas TaxID=1808958 RepID=A0AAW0F537_9TRYP